jgi:hypothetical protein
MFPPFCQLDWSDAWFATFEVWWFPYVWALLMDFELEFPKLKSKLWSLALLDGSAAYIIINVNVWIIKTN